MAGNEKPQIGVPRASDLVTGLMNEGVKTHSTYDGSSRCIAFYQAPIDAQNGDVCLVTQYTYFGATVLVVNSKDGLGVWDSTWDF